MPRFEPIDRAEATGRAREMLDEVTFGQQVVAAPAEVTDEQVDELRGLGYTDEQIAEVVGLVSLQVLTGAFNLVAGIYPSTTARSAA